MGTVSFAVAILLPVLGVAPEDLDPGSAFPDGIYIREQTSGAGTVFDPRIDRVWYDWSTGGIVNTAESHLVTETVSLRWSTRVDTRDAFGAGQLTYENEDRAASKQWQWNSQDFHDPAGVNVLVNFSGFKHEHQDISEYSGRGLLKFFEMNEEIHYSNETEANLGLGRDATRRVAGFRTETDNEWNELLEYKTVEDHATMQFETGIWEGTLIEKSETLTPPIKLKVKTTVTWAEWDPAAFAGAGAWVQKEKVTETVEDGPWALMLEMNEGIAGTDVIADADICDVLEDLRGMNTLADPLFDSSMTGGD